MRKATGKTRSRENKTTTKFTSTPGQDLAPFLLPSRASSAGKRVAHSVGVDYASRHELLDHRWRSRCTCRTLFAGLVGCVPRWSFDLSHYFPLRMLCGLASHLWYLAQNLKNDRVPVACVSVSVVYNFPYMLV